ncbi:hypothetical protein [Aquiflexum sp.]|uniref:hypothetical protein n=1 Tax=Aquiflexum sp. TaxID=1872584 RepID=UPI0035940EAB
MKAEKSNKTGKVIKTILMLIGAGAVVGFFSSQRNRAKTQEKAQEFGNYLLEKVKDEKDMISNKTKELIRKTKAAGEDVDNVLSEYRNKIV